MPSERLLSPRPFAIALAALPAALAVGIPACAAALMSSAIVSNFGLSGGVVSIATWLLSLSIAVSVIGLKFLMPWSIVERPFPAASWLVWSVSILMSASIVVTQGLRFIPPDTAPSLVGVGAALWICIEVIATLVFPALSRSRVVAPEAAQNFSSSPTRTEMQPPSRAAPSSPSADALFAWMVSLFDLPTEQRPYGIHVDASSYVLVTSQRHLASAWKQPRGKVVRRLNRLERQGRIKIEATEEGTSIQLLFSGSDRTTT